ncbi:MAG: DUF2157 domain-containing protein [Acidobacteriota bacterium]
MISLEPELQALRPRLGDAAADALIARERREIFSIYPELRILGWLGATLLATAAGIVLKNNLERIGPLALAAGMAVAAAACYAFVTWRRQRASVVDDYVLLLGALLVTADVAFIESQFHLLDSAWKHHLLLLAVIHGLGAYVFRSRMLLSLSISALAGWLGADRNTSESELAVPAFICAAILLIWRAVDLRIRGTSSQPPSAKRQPFAPTFEHFAANIALLGALTLTFDRDTRILGTLFVLAIAAAVIVWGFRVREEWFVLYAFVYAVIAADILLIDTFKNEVLTSLILVVSMIGAIATLLVLHARFKRMEARP